MEPSFILLVSLCIPLLALVLVVHMPDWGYKNMFKSSDPLKFNSIYDYIIVGGGTAGCVLARRLSENVSSTVLLLEAGKEETFYQNVDMPAAAPAFQRTEADWAYETVPQINNAFGMENQIHYWPAGKVLGGGSSINYMCFTRGSRHDFDRWQAMGAESWNYQNVLPYFMKAEDNDNDTLLKSGFHGKGGPFAVSDSDTTQIRDNVEEAMRELGFQESEIYGALEEGFSRMQVNIRSGRRVSTASSYLRPVMDKTNLQVLTEAVVTRIQIGDKRAVAVEFDLAGLKQIVRANKEVILSAGAIESPKILMLSGIGPKDHLEDLKVPVLADLPVGANLQNHIFTNAIQVEIEEAISLNLNKMQQVWSLVQYKLFHSGALQYSLVETIWRGRASCQPQEDKVPSILLAQTGAFLPAPFFSAQNMKQEVTKALYNGLDSSHGFEILTMLMLSQSRGTVRLQSTNPLDPPLIDPNYLSDPKDVLALLEGIKIGRKVVKTKALRRMGAKLSTRVHPLCSDEKPFSDAYWLCFIKHNTINLHHYSGTCKMGGSQDSSAVVDPQLRVRGVGNLRVVDASVMPQLVSANPAAAIVMIAEKAADMIQGVKTVDTITVPAS